MARHSTQSQRFGLAKESVRGTAEAAPTKWYPTRGLADLPFDLALLEDGGIRGVKAKYPPISGIKKGEGKLPLYFDPSLLGEVYYSLLGAVASVEDDAITIGATNDKLDFNIGAAELTATVASATYDIGTAHTQAGTLCKAIYDAIVAAEAVGTYTVSYSRTTKLFTITRSTGELNILWKTGTNGADGTGNTIGTTLGYSEAADDTGALTYSSDTAVAFSMTHTFTEQTGITPPAYTLFMDRSVGVLKYNRACVKALNLKGSVDGLVEAETDWLYENEASGDIGSPSFPTQRYHSFQHVDFKIAGASNTDVKEWELTIDNGAKALRTLQMSQLLTDIVAPEKLMISGGFTIYFQNTTERDKFLANTATSVQILSQGDVIHGTTKWKNDITIYDARYTAFPYGDDEGLLAAKASFEGFYSATDAKTIQIVTTNQDASY